MQAQRRRPAYQVLSPFYHWYIDIPQQISRQYRRFTYKHALRVIEKFFLRIQIEGLAQVSVHHFGKKAIGFGM